MNTEIKGDPEVIRNGFIYQSDSGLHLMVNLYSKMTGCACTWLDDYEAGVGYCLDEKYAEIIFRDLPVNVDKTRMYNGRNKDQDEWLLIPWDNLDELK
jgi:hypothetical protein